MINKENLFKYDHTGKGGMKRKENTTVLVTTLRNKTTGRPAGKITRIVGSGHDASIDEAPSPIDPKTGEPIDFQVPLPQKVNPS